MEEETIFDPTIKKKSKKKKVFDLEAAIGAAHEEGDPMDTSTTPDKENMEPSTNNNDLDDLEFNSSALKKSRKKLKKPTFNFDDLENNLPDASPGANERGIVENGEAHGDSNVEDDFTLDMDFSKTKKKKKKKKDLDELVRDDVDKKHELKEEENESSTWSGSDRDYTYDELLTRVFEIMREKNPDMVGGKEKRFKMRPPQVLKIGSKKTSFANFNEICKTLHRQPKHLLDFLLAELGTNGSVDGNNQLIIKGRFQQQQIQNVLKRYIKEYVSCHTCRSHETILQKDTRLFFLQCETCGSRCSVVSIKSGFQAVTVKRAAIRAKTV